MPASVTPEWVKILVTAVLGMLTGVIADPLRALVGRHLAARRAVDLIYLELAIIYEFCGATKSLPASSVKFAISRIPFDHYDYYYLQNREAFCLIPLHYSLTGLIRELKLDINQVIEGTLAPHQGAVDMVGAIEARLEGGVLDRQKFNSIMTKMQEGSKSVRGAIQETLWRDMASGR